MKTIEVQVTFTAKVENDVAERIQDDPQPFFTSISLANVLLLEGQGGSVHAKFTASETTNIEVME